MAEADFIKAFREELTGLRQPEKPRINGLTMLAEANQNYAEAIVRAIEQHIHECPPPARLPALYLVDSIIKNVQEPFKTLFSRRLDQVFGEVWRTTLPDKRGPLTKLCNTWTGVLAADVVARVHSRMGANGAAQQMVPTAKVPAPAAAPVQQQQPGMGFQHIQQQQQQPILLAQPQPHQQPQQQQLYQQPHVIAGVQQAPPPQHIVLQPGGPLPGGVQIVSVQHAAPPPQPMYVVGPNGQLLTVTQQPQILPAPAVIPQHMLGGLPPVSPAHPSWQQQPPQMQQQLPPHMVPAPRPMHPQQQQMAPAAPGPMMRRSPAYPASPAVVQASPHHTSSTRSPHHLHSAPGSSHRSGSPAQQAEQFTASLSNLLQGLTKVGYLNDPALKTTSFDPAFLKKEHKGVIAALKEASDKTRARFKDIQFQRNKRRKDAKSSSSLLSRGWYLPVDSWITGTTMMTDKAAEQAAEAEEQASEEEGPPPVPTVPADPSQTHCAISQEAFENVYDQDQEQWVYRGVVRLQGEEAERHGVPDGSLVKVECLAEADLGSSPVALAAAAAAAGAAGGEDEADLAAAAVAASAAGQGGATAAVAAAADGLPEQEQQELKPALLAEVKYEQQQHEEAEDGQPVDMKLDPASAAAAAAAAGGDVKPDLAAAGAAAAAGGGVKRDADDNDQQQQQQQGTPTKKRRVSAEP